MRGSSTRSSTTTRFSAVMTGVCTFTGGTAGPRFSVPKYFSTSFLVAALSMSPAIAIVALFGA